MVSGELALGGVGVAAAVALIMVVFKQFVASADRRVYLGLSLVLALGLSVLFWVRTSGVPVNLNGWIDMLWTGIIIGQGVGKGYDEVRNTLGK